MTANPAGYTSARIGYETSRETGGAPIDFFPGLCYHVACYVLYVASYIFLEEGIPMNRERSLSGYLRTLAQTLSLELGQSTEYINQIENGNNMPSVEGLLNFCEYFGITLGEFFDEYLEYPVEYKNIIKELNKLDSMEVEQIYRLLKLINKKR